MRIEDPDGSGGGADDGTGETGEPVDREGMVLVPGGDFLAGCDADQAECAFDEPPQASACLGEFWIDETEVTVGAYTACVANGACRPADTMSEFCTAQGGVDNVPITCVEWAQAFTFCTWQGKVLPTGLQWEKAARGTDGRRYPWGSDAPSCALASMNEACTDPADPDQCPRSEAGCGSGAYLPVGSKPAGASPFGAHDMAGNVWEWVDTEYDPERLAMRGGAHSSNGADFETWNVFGSVDAPWDFVGFRCATPPRAADCQPPPPPDPPEPSQWSCAYEVKSRLACPGINDIGEWSARCASLSATNEADAQAQCSERTTRDTSCDFGCCTQTRYRNVTVTPGAC